VTNSSHVIALSAIGCMFSTRAKMPERNSRSSGLQGATEKPQLPATTVVTPWKHDTVAYGSKVICGS
jgi:hypothetical protein